VREGPRLQLPRYLQGDTDGLGGVLLSVPSREDVGIDVREKLVVELYAR
jgi:ribosomal protein S4